MNGAELTERALGFLVSMMKVENPDELPSGLVERCQQVNALVQRAKPYGSLESTQTLASIVEQCQREAFRDDK